MKKAAPSHTVIKLLEASDGEENLKSGQRKMAFYVQRDKDKNRFLIVSQKQCEQEDGEATCSNYKHTKKQPT